MLEADDFAILALEGVEELDSLVSGLLTGTNHATERSAHTRVAIVLRELHAGNDEAGENLSGVVDDETFGLVHIHRTHVTELDQTSGRETLDGKGTEGSVVTASADDDGSGDG